MRILISGKDSYIGDHIADWLKSSKNNNFEVDVIDVRNPDWISFDFSSYDTIVHVAGIVHRKDITSAEIYEKVNTQLPYDIAKKAKKDGVSQFIFLSTMAVYGIGKRLTENYVDITTPINPTNLYGKSKYDAEKKLRTLEDSNFIITIIRPPNVYGKGCKGSYISGYASIVKNLPIIPEAYVNVKQSVLYIDNLCEFLKLLILNKDSGIYLPQDDKAISAVELMEAISDTKGYSRNKSKFLGHIAKLFSFTTLALKGFGGVAYRQSASQYKGGNYVVVPFEEAIRRTLI